MFLPFKLDRDPTLSTRFSQWIEVDGECNAMNYSSADTYDLGIALNQTLESWNEVDNSIPVYDVSEIENWYGSMEHESVAYVIAAMLHDLGYFVHIDDDGIDAYKPTDLDVSTEQIMMSSFSSPAYKVKQGADCVVKVFQENGQCCSTIVGKVISFTKDPEINLDMYVCSTHSSQSETVQIYRPWLGDLLIFNNNGWVCKTGDLTQSVFFQN